MDLRVLVFTLLTAAVSGVLFAAPALRLSHPTFTATIQGGARSSGVR